LISCLFVLVVALVLALENPKAEHDDEDENHDDSINQNKILVMPGMTDQGTQH